MVVVSSEGADGSEGDVGGGGTDGSVMLHTEEDSLHEVWEIFLFASDLTKACVNFGHSWDSE